MMLTIKIIAKRISEDHSQFAHYKSSFLDQFYKATTSQRKVMIAEEPASNLVLPERILPFLAGMVEKLCNDYQLTSPNWIYNKKYYLATPNFWLNATGKLRILLLVESPVEFKSVISLTPLIH
ncbi:MAG: hypothetical protein RLZ12_642 [Bacillota bacterium]|jgi:hypothetical protein